ncbi:MAG: restriction endonuclease subunit S [Desulfovibrio sp.]|nr:restriction endonuclease subunit S [Desulfovibrio sp.]
MKKLIPYNFGRLLTWLKMAVRPGEKISPDPFSWPEGAMERFSAKGLTTTSVTECDALASIVTRDTGAEDLLEKFLKCQAPRMYLFSTHSLIKSSFTKKVLDIDANLLDASILLPKDATCMPPGRVSLYVLDKMRIADKRTFVTFIDASELDIDKTPDIDLSAAPGAVKDFRDIVIKKEPVVASFHCAAPVLATVRERASRPLSKVAEIIRSPMYSSSPGSEAVDITCLSPRDFAPYGYTLPTSGEIRRYTTSAATGRCCIRANDILFVSQRNVGKVALIDPSFSEKFWCGSTFTFIIRCHDVIDPRVLFTYLSSDAARLHVEAVTAYSEIPRLSISHLRDMPIPLFSADEVNGMISAFDELERIRRELARLSLRAEELRRKYFFDSRE